MNTAIGIVVAVALGSAQCTVVAAQCQLQQDEVAVELRQNLDDDGVRECEFELVATPVAAFHGDGVEEPVGLLESELRGAPVAVTTRRSTQTELEVPAVAGLADLLEPEGGAELNG